MTEKFENQQVKSGAEIGLMLGAKCTSFKDWPEGGLPTPLLLREERRIETEFGPIAEIKAGSFSKKAERALAAVYESHPIIKTGWGMLYGRTTKCEQGTKMYHAVEIHNPANWALDLREIRDRFGSGEEFSPYADVAYELLKYEVSQHNVGAEEDYVLEVTRETEKSLLEISCKFKRTGDRVEENEAFAALMRFMEKLVKSGRLGEIMAQSCHGSVVQQAMVSALWSTDMGGHLDAMKKISGSKAKVCKYSDLPALSSVSVAAALMTLGVNAGKWPRACYPEDLIAVHKERLDLAIRLEQPKLGVRERSRIAKEALSEMLMPGAVLRTTTGMIRLALQTVEKQSGERGAYQLTIYLARKWESQESGKWSKHALQLLMDRSARLLGNPADYEIEINDCGTDYGMLQVSCDFDLYGGEEAQNKCKQALVDYVFTIYATGMIDDVMLEACSKVDAVVFPLDLKAA